MKVIKLFTDGSVNTKSKIGYGAFLAITNFDLPVETLKEQVKVKRFEKTSSTKLELQTLLWALDEIKENGNKIFIYTDSQNIIGLKGRRERFEKNNYHSNKGKLLNNYELYQQFFKMTDKINCEFIKVEGHKPSGKKLGIEKIFTLVDMASRNALRENF